MNPLEMIQHQSKCHKVIIVYHKADFHSMQNVARSTFSERFLLNYKQSSGTNSLPVVDFTHFKRKRSLKIDRATFCTEWKSAYSGIRSVRIRRKGALVFSLLIPPSHLERAGYAEERLR